MVRIKHHKKGYKALLTSKAMQAVVKAEADRVAGRCGEGYVAELTPNPHTRARAAVIAVTHAARRDNSANNTILKNL